MSGWTINTKRFYWVKLTFETSKEEFLCSFCFSFNWFIYASPAMWWVRKWMNSSYLKFFFRLVVCEFLPQKSIFHLINVWHGDSHAKLLKEKWAHSDNSTKKDQNFSVHVFCVRVEVGHKIYLDINKHTTVDRDVKHFIRPFVKKKTWQQLLCINRPALPSIRWF